MQAPHIRLNVFPAITIAAFPAILCFKNNNVIVKVEGKKIIQDNFFVSENQTDWQSSSSDLFQWLEKVRIRVMSESIIDSVQAGVFVPDTAQSNVIATEDSEDEDECYCEEDNCPLKTKYAHQHVNENLFKDATQTQEFMRAM